MTTRRVGRWAGAVVESVVAALLGSLTLTVVLGLDPAGLPPDPSPAQVLVVLTDVLVGLAASVAIGPLRLVNSPRAVPWHLAILAGSGLSAWSVVAAGVALVRLGRQRSWRLDGVALGLLAASTAVGAWLNNSLRGPTPVLEDVLAAGLALVGAILLLMWGHLQGTRHALVASLRDQTAAAERAREAAERAAQTAEQLRLALARAHAAEVESTRAEERAAIARDMHDSLSHHLSTIALHAGALSYRRDVAPEVVAETARTVRDEAQAANTELRHVLRTLRTQPLATAADLESLVATARQRGQDVRLTWSGVTSEEVDERPRHLSVALVRILQELLTNAAKHAPGQQVDVRLAREAEAVILTVTNRLPDENPGALSTGYGLEGVGERARLLGGSVRYGHEDDRFVSEVRIPW